MDALREISAVCAGDYRPSISLVLPAYNEAATIEQAVREAVAAMSAITHDFEVLVIDDGCTDNTAQLVEATAQRWPQVRLVRQPRNLGYGAALRRGFAEAKNELVGFTDSDCQFDLTELNRLVMLTKDYQIVSGYRIDRKDPWLRRFYSAGYNVLVRLLLGTRLRDCDCALKLFHRDALAQLSISTDGYLVNGEMLARARQLDYSICEVGVSHRERAGGTSKVSITHIPLVFASLLRCWWNTVLFPATAEEQLATTEQWSPRKTAICSALLLAIASLLLLANLRYALIEPDETRYAQISLTMFESGDWFVPRLHGEPYLDKPPLLYWATATSFALFGPSEWSARLPCALAAILTVLGAFFLGRGLVGDRAAWLGSVLLSVTGGFVIAGRYVLMDSLLMLFVTVGLLCGLRAMQNRSRTWAWCLAMGVALGLGVMTKGPVAPILCLPPILGVAWLTRSYEILRLRNLLAVFVPLVAIAAPWFFQIAEAQAEFVGYFFWKHNFQRFVNAFDHAHSWWFYVPVLAFGMLPGSFLAPAMAVYLGRRSERHCLLRTRELGALLAAALWIVLFFSVASCKLPTYVLPAIPLFTLALGKMLADVEWSASLASLDTNRLVEKCVARATWALVCGTACASVAAVVVLLVFNPRAIAWAILYLAVPVASVVLLWKNQLNSQVRLASAAWVVCVLATVFGYGRVVPEVANWRSVSLAAARVQRELPEPLPIVFFGYPTDVARFAIPGGVVGFHYQQLREFEEYMAHNPSAIVVASRTDFASLRENCSARVNFQGPEARSRVYLARSINSLAQGKDTSATAAK